MNISDFVVTAHQPVSSASHAATALLEAKGFVF
jgi:hypothetical protein